MKNIWYINDGTQYWRPIGNVAFFSSDFVHYLRQGGYVIGLFVCASVCVLAGKVMDSKCYRMILHENVVKDTICLCHGYGWLHFVRGMLCLGGGLRSLGALVWNFRKDQSFVSSSMCPSSRAWVAWRSASSPWWTVTTCSLPSPSWRTKTRWCGSLAGLTSTPSSPCSFTWCCRSSSPSSRTPMRPSRYWGRRNLWHYVNLAFKSSTPLKGVPTESHTIH